jgi:sec-independent protein translocase protein TatC
MVMAVSRRFLALNDPDPKNMTVIEHLEEVRKRLFVIVIVTTVAAIGGLFFYDQVLAILLHPLKGLHNLGFGDRLVVSTITGSLFLRIKLALIPAAVVCMPVWLYEMWMFVAPAFEIETRKYVVPFVIIGMVLFLIGASVGYVLFPRYFGFMIGIGGKNIVVLPDANNVLNQFAVLLLLFGAVFELPVVLVLLSKVGIVSSVFLRKRRKIMVFIALFSGMIITPGADPITPLIVSLLLIFLYEISIVVIRLGHR